jgi:endogenous inhibitor of DNA gyrase (YacG/DUF329 family)
VNPKKPRTPCLSCGKEPARSFYKYCSNACQSSHQRNIIIRNWKAGKITGLNTIGLVSKPVKKYLRDKFGNMCSLCGWSKLNKKTGLIPLVADHIDGNWRNNTEKNLRLICPNCDSLTSTYAGSNRGRGGRKRAVSKRARGARLVA